LKVTNYNKNNSSDRHVEKRQKSSYIAPLQMAAVLLTAGISFCMYICVLSVQESTGTVGDKLEYGIGQQTKSDSYH
jgi:hypothetical protein